MTEDFNLGFDIEDMCWDDECPPPQAYIDIVFVIDITASMRPIIGKLKSFATRIYEKIATIMEEVVLPLVQLRVKVISYRNFYHINKRTDTYETAIEESGFFYLPEDNEKFRDFVSTLEASGGGDIPESGLEALVMAMKTDWVQLANKGDKKRNIIVLFTGALAHPFEKEKEHPNYPENMLLSLEDLINAWQGAGPLGYDDRLADYRMDPVARRLLIYAPDVYPWNGLFCSLEDTIHYGIDVLTHAILLNHICSAI